MALISLEGMRFHAYHGLYEEERIIGSDFLLDVWIDTDIKNASVVNEHETDKVDNSINYVAVYDICRIIMLPKRKEDSTKLLETLVQDVIFQLKYQFKTMREVRVRVRKLNPPVDGLMDWAAVLDVRNFTRLCAKSGDDMICYKEGDQNDGTCWCMQGPKDRIHPRTLEMLEQQFPKGCLSPKILAMYEG